MKKRGIINVKLAALIAGAGHFDKIAVCDAGFPIPKGVDIIDLAIVEGYPGFIEVLACVLDELKVENFTIASELFNEKHDMLDRIKKLLPEIPFTSITHEEFKKAAADVKAVIRTGENKHFCNAIFMCGVTF